MIPFSISNPHENGLALETIDDKRTPETDERILRW